jgi:chromosome segregation ATPase
MWGTELLQVVLVVQLSLVSLLFLSALRRSARQHPTRPLPLERPAHRPRAEEPATDTETLEQLEEQRAQLLAELARIRSDQTKEEVAFRARRREVMLELHEDRRIANELNAAEPELRNRVESLRAEVEHLERRRPELAAEIQASTRSSTLLRGRIADARRELDEMRRDRDRLCERLEADKQRLSDLAKRRALLHAETEELAALARSLQPAAGVRRLLSQVTDGELRDAAELQRRTLRSSRRLLVSPLNGHRVDVGRA